MTTAQPVVFPQADLVRDLRNVILQLVGCASTMQSIGQDMVTTPLEDDNTFCPEIFVRSMASEVYRQADQSMTELEKLEWAIDAIVKAKPPELNGWIEITPETLPTQDAVVLIWSPLLGRSEPVFYCHRIKDWCRAFDDGQTLLEDPDVQFFRYDTLPATGNTSKGVAP